MGLAWWPTAPMNSRPLRSAPLADRRRVRRPLIECGRGALARLEDLCCGDDSGCASSSTREIPDSFDAWYAANADVSQLDTGDYTDGEIEWLEAATDAIECASERFADLSCNPYPAPACHKFRACWPCGCPPTLGCNCCIGCGWAFELPLCGDVLEATLTTFDENRLMSTRTLSSGQLSLINGLIAAPGVNLSRQDPLEPLGCAGTWELEVIHGTRISDMPWIIRQGVADMACVQLDRCLPSSKCDAPSNAETMSHDGITYRLLDPTEFLGTGQTSVRSWNDALAEHQCPKLIEGWSGGGSDPIWNEPDWYVTKCEVSDLWL